MATNPRLVKEVTLALSLNYEVIVVAFVFNNWSKQLNDSIKATYTNRIRWIEISGDRTPFFPWFLSTLLNVLCKQLVTFKLYNSFILSQALQKRTVLLSQALKVCKNEKADFIVAHNPGAFYPTYQLAKMLKIPFGIDVEDYHPGEYQDTTTINLYKTLLKKTIPKAAYITYAAEPIGQQVLIDTHYKGISKEVLNAFPKQEFEIKVNDVGSSSVIRIVWFSQHISKGRGLDELLKNWSQLAQSSIELHLIGALDTSLNEWIATYKNIIIHPPMTQPELHQFLLTCHVGLALEDKHSNYNRNLCITNKIIAYYQAGLAIIATETLGQQSFFKRFQPKGNIIEPDDLIQTIQDLNPATFANKPLQEQQLDWEDESKKLQTIWKNL